VKMPTADFARAFVRQLETPATAPPFVFVSFVILD